MPGLAQRIATLSPEKRKLFLKNIAEKRENTASYPVLMRRKNDDLAPLSFAQQRLWFLEQLEPGLSTYTIPLALRLHGAFNVSALEQTLREIVRRHESLRTRFVSRAGVAYQQIDPIESFVFSIVPVEQEEQVQSLLEQEAQQPFDLEQGPLFRACLLLLSDREAVLLLTLHHSIADGWSMGVLTHELGQLYPAFVAGQPSPLPELPLQYADYALWQRQWLQGEVLDVQLDYWKKQLGGAEPLALPTDRARPAIQTHRGASQRIELSGELSQALKLFSQREGCTLFMTLLAAWQVLLSHYSGQDDISVGTPIANRTQAQLEDLIGFFINTLVLRSDLSGNPDFREVLRRVKEVSLGAYAHQDIPFEQLVDVVQPERDRSRSPLFQVLFVLQNLPEKQQTWTDIRIEAIEIEHKTAKFDLSLAASEAPQGLIFDLEYNTDLFDAETIERLLGHWQRLLSVLITQPEIPVQELTFLSSQERQQLLFDWNEPQQQFPVVDTLVQRFEQQARMHPQAIAVSDEQQSLTYAQLNARANQLAHALRRQGVEPNQLVGLSMDRSVQLLVGLLGILKASGAYLPLDPMYPTERLHFMLADAGVERIVTEPAHTRLFAARPDLQLFLLDPSEQCFVDESIQNLENRNTPQDLAYVIYTSGSTGKPKGVCIPHANVQRLFAGTEHWFSFDARDVWTLFHSYAFDFSVWEIWGALLYGGKLVVVSYETSRTPSAFYQLLLDEQVTILNQTPSAFEQLQQAEALFADSSTKTPGALRAVIFGGEALELGRLRPWLQRHGDEHPQLINMYGITETTVHVTYRRIRWEDMEQGRGSVIGRAIPDLQLYVLNRWLQPVPIGVAGQLYVGGAGLAAGYLQREELTAQRFIRSPFSHGDQRLYQTGDLVRYRSNGELEYLGRIDQQVKIRGFRIELGEIEDRLLKLAGIRACTVQVSSDAQGDKRLVGYIVQEEEGAWETGSLRQQLRTDLPDYMVPSLFISLPELPLTANGKLDRNALPAPESSLAQLALEYVAPRTPLEMRLAAIWSAVLQHEKVGIHANFFTLGGDSIRSIQIVAKAKEQEIYFTLQQLFQYQTIAELAAQLQTSQTQLPLQESVLPFALISEKDRLKLPEDVEDAYPLALMQAGMLYHSQLNSANGMYHDITSYHLEAVFHPAYFQQAIQLLAMQHPVLRTSFDITNYSEFLQLVHKNVQVPFSIHDITAMTELEQREALLHWIEEDKLQVLNLAEAPLIRITVHLRSENSFQFSLTCHHAILDGWSVASFVTEVFKVYLDLLQGKKDLPVAPLTHSHHDFVALERLQLSAPAEHVYWQEMLANYSVTPLPIWSSVEPDEEDVPQFTVTISAEMGRDLRKLAQRLTVPYKSVLLAAHLFVLTMLSGQHDVITGYVSNGRPETMDSERILGLFLNTLPLRVHLGGGSWRELIQAVFQQEKELLAHRWYPLAEIQRRYGGTALFNVIFNYTHFHIYKDLLSSPGASEVKVLGQHGFERNNFALSTNVMVDPISDQVRLSLQSNGETFTTPHLQRIAGYYVQVLAAIAHNAMDAYQSQNVLPDQEQEWLLRRWNATTQPYARDKSIHQLFEEQVERTPDAPAIHFADKQFTYREANQLANVLAHQLLASGVGPGMLVGHCMERSAEMLVALLGILKTGAAYVPIDPEYPQDRVAYMLEDSQVQVIVSQPWLVASLPAHQAQIVCLEDLPVDMIVSNPDIQFSPQQPAYVIYTSGSTGKPKGTILPHQSVVNFFESIARRPGMSAEDRILAVTSLSFDIAVLELLLPLTLGAQVFIVSRAVATNGTDLVHWLEKTRPTLLQATPATWRLLLASGWSGEEQTSNAPGLKMLCGGEVLPQEIVQPLLERGASLWNMYGPTETTIWSTLAQVVSEQQILIGQPIANTQIYILNAWFAPTPVGVAGELYIAGDGLAWGYLHRADLTAERFLPDPFSAIPGARMYRTGDLAHWNVDGKLACLGRTDRQVKLRGHRIELGEIETVLAQHPDVQSCAVIVYEIGAGNQQLVGYVVPVSGANPTQSELRLYLLAVLPEYMVPNICVLLEALPLTPNGKVDRKNLPAPVALPESQKGPLVAPRNSFEELILTFWREILGYPQISIDDNFFEIGGHSLLVNQLIARLRSTFHVQISMRSIFQAATIQEQAVVIQELLQTEQDLLVPPLLPLSRDESIPLSFAQQRLWLLEQLVEESSAYTMPLALKVRGNLDVTALEQSLQRIVVRHETLRTVFLDRDGVPVQVILPVSPVHLRHQDLRGLDAVACEAELECLIQHELQQPFSLAHGPLLRACLFWLAGNEYVLVMAMHHIIWDGWSMGIFVRELTTLYKAEHEKSDAHLPHLPVQYADYASWQRNWLQGKHLNMQLAYWKMQLAGADVLQLPCDHPRPAQQTQNGNILLRQMPAELATHLKQLSQQEGVTLFMLLLAAFQTLLSRYSGQDDISVGTPIANRDQVELEHLIGFFVNTLVLRSDLSGNPTFSELLRRVRETTLNAYMYKDVPFEKVVEAVQPERDPSRSPLFQVLFSLQSGTQTNRVIEVLDDLSISPLEVSGQTARFDISLILADTEEGLSCAIEYNTDLFEQATIERLFTHWQTLLASVVSNPTQHLSELTLLSEREREQIVCTWNDTDRPYTPACWHHLFELQVARTPQQDALVFGEQSLSYQQLDQRANQLAHYLLQRGIQRGDRVGVCMERSFEMVVSILAILKAGAAYVTLDPAYPFQRLDYMVEDAQIQLILSQQSLANQLSFRQAQLVYLDMLAPRLAQEKGSSPDVEVGASDLAYIIYTSGSTGKPKGVLVPHYGLANLVETQQQAFALTPADRILQFASISFDASVWDIVGALCTGATLCLAQADELLSLHTLIALIGRQRISMVTLAPSMLAQLNPEDVPGLSRIVVVGEACSEELMRRWVEPAKRRFYNAYGPTESTICATIMECTPQLQGRPPIGRPIPRFQIYLLDSSLQPVPVGVAGELHIAGIGLAWGYLDKPELTATKFIPDHFSAKPGARLYRSGDLARYLPDGTIEFLGRIDHQVKLRGLRIELGEIEDVLNLHDAVRECLVLVREDRPGHQSLVAYLVGPSLLPTVVAELREMVRECLPEYMLPSAFILLDAFPVTPNGKIDRNALPAPETLDRATEQSLVAPRSALEIQLLDHWRAILGRTHIGIHDNFFELGGHSLLATQLLTRLHKAGMELSLRSIFTATTIAEQATLLERQLHGNQSMHQAALTVVARNQHIPLSFAQQRLWFLDQLHPGDASQNIPLFLQLEGMLDQEALSWSVQEIIRRHESLRTTFQTIEGEAVQCIAPPDENFVLPYLDFSVMERDQQEQAVKELLSQEAGRAFIIAQDRLLRTLLVKVQPQKYLFLLIMHHIITDGWSIGIFSSELQALYQARVQRQPSPLSEPVLHYADFAVWQRQWLQGDACTEHLNYWKQRLNGAQALEYPVDHPRPEVSSHRGANYTFTLSEQITRSLKALSQQEAATIFMTLLAAFKCVLARKTGVDDIVVGTDIANRTHQETEGMIGFFVNLLALRTDLSGEPSFRQVLARVRENVLGAFTYQDLPYDVLVDRLHLKRSYDRTPLINLLFVLQNISAAPAIIPQEQQESLRISSLPNEVTSSKFDFAVFMAETVEGGMSGSITYSTDLFDAVSMQNLIVAFEHFLQAVLAQPDRKIYEVPLPLSAEMNRTDATGNALQVLHVDNGVRKQERRSANLRKLGSIKGNRTKLTNH
ncbi:non-ribosomal peptide synthetase [Dictyobacter arantiisoli]|uniref:Carrier domain-containing protein n=1 Tax=Dictyobacter arantiisoli TaxID=2014874 RepID=A0A5A5T7U2_9CHLR|nr:non-ribosomal peptide synthetase [Dictyobacter arantiisoli]GCF07286.1 hypothetical protein KDI_08500 [Dictyobacter arantiisoli]